MALVLDRLMATAKRVGGSSLEHLYRGEEVPVSHDHVEVVEPSVASVASQAEIREDAKEPKDDDCARLRDVLGRCVLIEYPLPEPKMTVGADLVMRFTSPVEQLEGKKFDQGKDPWGLMPFDALRGILKVLQYGKAKYGPRNWEAGMSWDRPYEAMMRHMTAWYLRENNGKDDETGFSHLWHAGCCILFLIAYEMRGVGRDDRPDQV
jgi:hypothetical protein